MVRYLQLAHNEWDAAAQTSRTKVLYSFGREDDLDRAAVERLVVSRARLLDPGRAAALTIPGDLAYLGSRPLGGTHVLDGIWHRLGLDDTARRSTRRPATGRWTGSERGKLAGVISTKPGLKRFLRLTPGGLLRIDRKKITAEEKLDGKYLIPYRRRSHV